MPTSSDLLLDTARVLWPGEAPVRVTRRTRPPAGTADWMVLPRLGAPRWLLPTAAPTTAGALAGQSSSLPRRVALGAVVAAHRRALPQRLPVRRLRVPETPDSLVAAVRGALGAEVDVAVRLGSWQHARTVVLRVFSPDGSTLAFGKLGIDDAGRAAVLAETDALACVTALGLRRVVHSRVLRHDAWRGLELLLVTPLLADGGPSHRVADEESEPPLDAMRELTGSAGARTAPLADSAWAERTGERVARVADPVLRGELGAHLGRLGRVAAPLSLGPSHGDWTAWNMTRDGARVLLWDWEHFGTDVPAGFDPVHFLAQRLRVATGTGPPAEAAWQAQARACLERDLGVRGPAPDVVLAAYLLDVNLRFVLDRQGTPLAAATREGWGLPLLRALVTSLPGGS
ncbi:hypothetical protein [uncultured Nocardioides sp.]|uniref:hypothetical protein n=1 Tax=uncultured Nocardioides sp. TaxID=198441 RepID=UPI002610BDC5|nr:hypothetical protein [uncultured Nocardioides sp.]